jgi:hypothetical protein
MTVFEEIIQLTDHISAEEKRHLIAYLNASLTDDPELEAYKTMPWEQFLSLTYGSLADDPIERNQPLYPDIRDEIE